MNPDASRPVRLRRGLAADRGRRLRRGPGRAGRAGTAVGLPRVRPRRQPDLSQGLERQHHQLLLRRGRPAHQHDPARDVLVASVTTGPATTRFKNQTAVTGGNGNTTWTTYNSWNQPESVTGKPPRPPRVPPRGPGRPPTPRTASHPRSPSPVVSPSPLLLRPARRPDQQVRLGRARDTPVPGLRHDLDGRIASATAPGGTNTFTWNSNSQLKSASGPSGASGLNYNNDQLVSSETTPAGTASYTVLLG